LNELLDSFNEQERAAYSAILSEMSATRAKDHHTKMFSALLAKYFDVWDPSNSKPLESFRTRRHSVRKLYSLIFDVQPAEIKKKMIAFTTSLKHLFRVRDKNFCTASDIPQRPAPNPVDYNLLVSFSVDSVADERPLFSNPANRLFKIK
jgi:hypothetical protein